MERDDGMKHLARFSVARKTRGTKDEAQSHSASRFQGDASWHSRSSNTETSSPATTKSLEREDNGRHVIETKGDDSEFQEFGATFSSTSYNSQFDNPAARSHAHNSIPITLAEFAEFFATSSSSEGEDEEEEREERELGRGGDDNTVYSSETQRLSGEAARRRQELLDCLLAGDSGGTADEGEVEGERGDDDLKSLEERLAIDLLSEDDAEDEDNYGELESLPGDRELPSTRRTLAKGVSGSSSVRTSGATGERNREPKMSKTSSSLPPSSLLRSPARVARSRHSLRSRYLQDSDDDEEDEDNEEVTRRSKKKHNEKNVEVSEQGSSFVKEKQKAVVGGKKGKEKRKGKSSTMKAKASGTKAKLTQQDVEARREMEKFLAKHQPKFRDANKNWVQVRKIKHFFANLLMNLELSIYSMSLLATLILKDFLLSSIGNILIDRLID
jgi:hypothetical protein